MFWSSHFPEIKSQLQVSERTQGHQKLKENLVKREVTLIIFRLEFTGGLLPWKNNACHRRNISIKLTRLTDPDCESWVNKLEQFFLAVWCLEKIKPAIKGIFLFKWLMIFKRQKSITNFPISEPIGQDYNLPFRWNCGYNSEYQFSCSIHPFEFSTQIN